MMLKMSKTAYVVFTVGGVQEILEISNFNFGEDIRP